MDGISRVLCLIHLDWTIDSILKSSDNFKYLQFCRLFCCSVELAKTRTVNLLRKFQGSKQKLEVFILDMRPLTVRLIEYLTVTNIRNVSDFYFPKRVASSI